MIRRCTGGWLLRSMFYRVHWWISVIDRYVRWSRWCLQTDYLFPSILFRLIPSIVLSTVVFEIPLERSQTNYEITRIFIYPRRIFFPLYILQIYKSSNFEILKSWKSLPKTQRRKRRVNWSRDNINLGDPRLGCGGWKGWALVHRVSPASSISKTRSFLRGHSPANFLKPI